LKILTASTFDKTIPNDVHIISINLFLTSSSDILFDF